MGTIPFRNRSTWKGGIFQVNSGKQDSCSHSGISHLLVSSNYCIAHNLSQIVRGNT